MYFQLTFYAKNGILRYTKMTGGGNRGGDYEKE